jgi:hypothetical protein
MRATEGMRGLARRPAGLRAVGGLALVAVAFGMLAPTPALAWWNRGVWVAGPGPGYWGPRPYYPRPYYYTPPVVVAPPPVYYAPPPVVYAPPPPPVYYPPPPAAARSCFTPALSCPMTVPRGPGSGCYCTDPGGNRVYGSAH